MTLDRGRRQELIRRIRYAEHEPIGILKDIIGRMEQRAAEVIGDLDPQVNYSIVDHDGEPNLALYIDRLDTNEEHEKRLKSYERLEETKRLQEQTLYQHLHTKYGKTEET